MAVRLPSGEQRSLSHFRPQALEAPTARRQPRDGAILAAAWVVASWGDRPSQPDLPPSLPSPISPADRRRGEGSLEHQASSGVPRCSAPRAPSPPRALPPSRAPELCSQGALPEAVAEPASGAFHAPAPPPIVRLPPSSALLPLPAYHCGRSYPSARFPPPQRSPRSPRPTRVGRARVGRALFSADPPRCDPH